MPLCKGLSTYEFDYFKKNFDEAVPNVVLSYINALISLHFLGVRGDFDAKERTSCVL